MENTHVEAAALTFVIQQLWCIVSEAGLFSSARVHENQRSIFNIQYGICSSAIETGRDLQERPRESIALLAAANLINIKFLRLRLIQPSHIGQSLLYRRVWCASRQTSRCRPLVVLRSTCCPPFVIRVERTETKHGTGASISGSLATRLYIYSEHMLHGPKSILFTCRAARRIWKLKTMQQVQAH